MSEYIDKMCWRGREFGLSNDDIMIEFAHELMAEGFSKEVAESEAESWVVGWESRKNNSLAVAPWGH